MVIGVVYNRNTFNWANSVRDYLNNLGFGEVHVWLNPYNVQNIKLTMMEIKQRIFDQGEQTIFFFS